MRALSHFALTLVVVLFLDGCSSSGGGPPGGLSGNGGGGGSAAGGAGVVETDGGTADGGLPASITLTGQLVGGTYTGGPISPRLAPSGPLAGYQLSCVTFGTPPVAASATADAVGMFALMMNAAGVPFGCFILDPSGTAIATLVFTTGSLNSLTVSFAQDGSLGTIIVDGTSGLAQATLTSGGTLLTGAGGVPCPLGTWLVTIGDVGCATPLIATVWVAKSPTGQYLLSFTSGPEGHLNCGYESGSNIPATYANGVLSFAGSSINSCPVTSMDSLTPDPQCQTASVAWTQVCGTCADGSACCGPQTCTASKPATRQ